MKYSAKDHDFHEELIGHNKTALHTSPKEKLPSSDLKNSFYTYILFVVLLVAVLGIAQFQPWIGYPAVFVIFSLYAALKSN